MLSMKLPGLLVYYGQIQMSNSMSLFRVYTSLCVYHKDMSVNQMIEVLEYEPSRSNETSDKHKASACIYTTKDEIESVDLDRHLEYLISHLKDIFKRVGTGNKHGFHSTVSVFWEAPSVSCGGPTLGSKYMKFFGDLGIDFWFDFWIE